MIRAATYLTLFASLFGAALSQEQPDSLFVIPPRNTTAENPKLLVFVPGGLVPNENYRATVEAIQAEVDFPLYAAVLGFASRLCITDGAQSIETGINRAFDIARGFGYTGDRQEDMFLMGHSLGVTCALTYLQTYPDALKLGGYLPMAGFINESGPFDLTNFPVPVMLAAGENNGGPSRPSRNSHWFRQFLALQEAGDADEVLARKPMLVFPDINHSDFCPGFFVRRDLPSSTDPETATKIIAESVGAFLTLNAGQQPAADRTRALETMKKALEFTHEIMDPMLVALELEVTGGNGLIFPDVPNAKAPWCQVAQEIIVADAGIDVPPARWRRESTYYPTIDGVRSSRASWNFTASGQMIVQTHGYNGYDFNLFGSAESGAATEVACKMLSPGRVAEQLDLGPDVRGDCKAVNQYAYEVALELAPERVLERYKRDGRGIVFADDVDAVAGPIFLETPLGMVQDNEALTVTSPFVKTSLNAFIFPGVTYCKMLSPARALDWIYTEARRPAPEAALEE